MMLPRALVAVLLFTAIFVAADIWTRVAAYRNFAVDAPSSIVDTTSVLDSRSHELHTYGNDRSDPRIDVNGNEVDEAVGDYRVDRRGEMYERHAPDTALLHLGAPTM